MFRAKMQLGADFWYKTGIFFFKVDIQFRIFLFRICILSLFPDIFSELKCVLFPLKYI